MNGSAWRGTGLVVLADDREARDHHRHPRSRLFLYCVASGVVGTAAATVISLAASGVTRIAVWATVIGLVSLIAGVAYDSTPVNLLWTSRHPARRHRPGS